MKKRIETASKLTQIVVEKSESCFWLRIESPMNSSISIAFESLDELDIDKIGHLVLIKDNVLVASLWPPLSREVLKLYKELVDPLPTLKDFTEKAA